MIAVCVHVGVSVCMCLLCVCNMSNSDLQDKLNISCVHSSAISELFRGIRAQTCNLIHGTVHLLVTSTTAHVIAMTFILQAYPSLR